MSLPDLAGVRHSICQHLLTELNGQIALDRIAYENRVFATPTLYEPLTNLPTLWIRETFFVISEDNRALQLHEARGRTLFEVFYPVGKGTERPEAVRQLIAEAFEKKYGLTNIEGLAVHLDKVVRGDSRATDELWYAAPISIYWRTYSVATANRTT